MICNAYLRYPLLPVPISYIAGSYFLFSIDAVTYLRREHHICGVLTGTLPQIPQQNVFLGLPLKLMPEEARLLVEHGVACIVDEVKAQREGMSALREADRRKYRRELESQGAHAMRLQTNRKEQQREAALKRVDAKKTAAAKKKAAAAATAVGEAEGEGNAGDNAAGTGSDEPEPSPSAPAPAAAPAEDTPMTTTTSPSRRTSITSTSTSITTAPYGTTMGITPATSHPPLPYSPSSSTAHQLLPPPTVPPSYPLFAHLHAEGYYLSPGLRFGCQYLAYPGDPLRFHSHFLVVAADWDEELDLMAVVAGGRLGTGVKKGFLIGGAAQPREDESGLGLGDAGSVRTFSVEWAGM
ncbi:SEN34 subunit of tRNA-splicing endonuclease [Aspergillus japonicus CBS 114.51]|uniref:tRNA-splicing endonuclease subunit Sen34 n=1 Tax=Aspergillus japonicus CBS 114.51 TaxID=1448312 RepID=A0A8T8WXE8_ASPJA|nr:SEN34 subunit of tRNA-splicing endonuclease [Aspergillus japonicus CBS 114.51]RAH79959.1 SEN34 subunit of tRNA-splicing endonuclease [Aspergillus japonicus CBS 114.51]